MLRGQSPLETMRSRGYAPVRVDLCCYPVARHLLGVSDSGLYATIEAPSGVIPSRADLRCIVGLEVHVAGDDAMTVHAVRDVCVSAGASRVVATVFDGRRDIPDIDRFKTVSVTDTKGILTWPN